MPQRNQGFTIYELLVTLALVAVLLGTAVPAFGIFIAKSRQTVEINALFHAVHRARKASIMRRKIVSICPTPDGQRTRTDSAAGCAPMPTSLVAEFCAASPSPQRCSRSRVVPPTATSTRAP